MIVDWRAHIKLICFALPLKVVICTDGLANKGVGNLDGIKF